MIQSLVKAIPSDGSITFFGDVSQQIYGTRTTWRHAGLNISKRWNFVDNYRNSRQIVKLALAITKMRYYKDLADTVEPIEPKADGPKPTLVKCSSLDKEINFFTKLAISEASSKSVAILVRQREQENLFNERLPSESIRLHYKMDQWVSGPGIRYGTYHAAKGLEFDLVLMPFCDDKIFPDPENVAKFGVEDAETTDGRLIYVGVTRAKTDLVISYSNKLTSLLPLDESFGESLYVSIEL
jgi:superfamily I DNA/RNA helicase